MEDRINQPKVNSSMVGCAEKCWDIPDDIRKIASENRRYVFRMLLGIIDDPALVGHIVTKAAKALYLIPEDKAKLKGNTIREWLNSFEVDGRNTPNAWACQAAMTVLIQWGKALEFTNRESYLTAVYYLNPSNDKKVLLASKEIIDKLL